MDLELARQKRRENIRRQEAENRQYHKEARADCKKIIDVIITFRPKRIWQWGSVLEGSRFNSRSDIDVAVEGITDPKTWFSLLDKVENLSSWPLDIIQMEFIHPAYRDLIKKKGIVVYEAE